MPPQPVDCVWWSPNNAVSGTCQAGHFGGTPSFGVCRNACPHRHASNELPSLTKQASNLGKAVGKAARAFISPKTPLLVPAEVKKERQAICGGCDKRATRAKIDYCSECGCPLATKLRAATESCPLGKWKEMEVQDLGKMAPLSAGMILSAEAKIRGAFEETHHLVQAFETRARAIGGAKCTACQRGRADNDLQRTFTRACRSLSRQEIEKLVEIFPSDVYLPYNNWNPTFPDLLEGAPE